MIDPKVKKLLLASMTFLAPAAHNVQDAENKSEDEASEIVVTSSLVSKPDVLLAETPQNITITGLEHFRCTQPALTAFAGVFSAAADRCN